MAFGPITSWEIDGETVETVIDFTFWAPWGRKESDMTQQLNNNINICTKNKISNLNLIKPICNYQPTGKVWDRKTKY